MDRDRTDSLRRQIVDRHWTDYVLRLDFMSMSRQPLVTSTKVSTTGMQCDDYVTSVEKLETYFMCLGPVIQLLRPIN